MRALIAIIIITFAAVLAMGRPQSDTAYVFSTPAELDSRQVQEQIERQESQGLRVIVIDRGTVESGERAALYDTQK